MTSCKTCGHLPCNQSDGVMLHRKRFQSVPSATAQTATLSAFWRSGLFCLIPMSLLVGKYSTLCPLVHLATITGIGSGSSFCSMLWEAQVGTYRPILRHRPKCLDFISSNIAQGTSPCRATCSVTPYLQPLDDHGSGYRG